MTKSPGHQKWPDHQISEEHPKAHYRATLDGKTIAASDHVIKLIEDNHPDRIYFPREDVKMELLESTSTTSECPFKGEAHYFSILNGKEKIEDAVWSYENPFEEHQDIKGFVAFYEEKFDALKISAG